MYLKRLEIQGFKSFANRTILDFIPPRQGQFSITAVVGPNGSGKSNITDAIRWVMGETSMKTIRSRKSEDIIFNGSEAKGALSAAEVIMILDNTGDKTEVGTEEISIARRLYRSGETEYLINNNPARLLDIHLLMAKAQFAEHAYSIVSQGMIDRLLTVSAAERKDFFDEASGIKELQIKRHQANLKLERTEENAGQARTIIQEIEPRLKLLARQVKKLEERQKVADELLGLQEKYYFTLHQRNTVEIKEIENKIKEIEKKYRDSFEQLQVIQTELAKLAQIASRQELFEKLQNDYQQIVREKNDLERQGAILEGQLHIEYSQAGKHNMNWLEQKVSELQKDKEHILGEFQELTNHIQRLRKSKEIYQKKLEELEIQKTQSVLKISRLQNDLLKNQSEQNFRDYSGLTAVKAVLDVKNTFGKIYGVVSELGKVDDEYRLALEVAAGQHIHSIVVEDEGVARQAIEYLRERRLGVATFLPLTKIKSRQPTHEEELLKDHPDIIDLAVNLIIFDSKFETIFSYIFGTSFIVKDLRAAEKVGIGRARMVTLAGDIAEKYGVMRGGYRYVKQQMGFSSKNSFDQAGRLEDYQKEIRAEEENKNNVDSLIEQVKKSLLEVRVELESLAAKSEVVSSQSHKIESELSELCRELKIIHSSPEEYGEELAKLRQTKEVLIKKISEHEERLRKTEQEIKQFNEEEEKKKQRVFELQEIMQQSQLAVNAVLAERNELKIEFAKIETKQEDLQKEVFNDLNLPLTSIVERLNEGFQIEELEGVVDQIQKLKYKLSLIGGIDEEVTAEYKTTKERFDFLSSELHDLEKALQDLTTLIAELDELMKKKRSQAFKKIRKEFNHYFQILFEGGSADLEEMYGETISEDEQVVGVEARPDEELVKKKKEKILTGIEVIANPPGKKVKYLNALSGGERTLTSIALICAILHNNPSPFVVLDEVEAALDEANTHRFIRIMKELATQSQFIIVTHNRVTMHAADALYGVVMNKDGVSKLLSVKLDQVDQYEEKVKKS